MLESNIYINKCNWKSHSDLPTLAVKFSGVCTKNVSSDTGRPGQRSHEDVKTPLGALWHPTSVSFPILKCISDCLKGILKRLSINKSLTSWLAFSRISTDISNCKNLFSLVQFGIYWNTLVDNVLWEIPSGEFSFIHL